MKDETVSLECTAHYKGSGSLHWVVFVALKLKYFMSTPSLLCGAVWKPGSGNCSKF